MLVDPALSGLPAFLTPNPGLNSGFMLAQVTAAALVSENKQRAYPASVEFDPDLRQPGGSRVDGGACRAAASRRWPRMCSRSSASNGSPPRRAATFTRRCARARRSRLLRARLRREVPHLDDDRYFHPDILAASRLAREGAIVEAVGEGLLPVLEARAMSDRRPDWLEVRQGEAPLIVSIPHGGFELREYEQRFVSPWLASQGRRLAALRAL